MDVVKKESYRKESLKGIMLPVIVLLLALLIQLRVVIQWGFFDSVSLAAGAGASLEAMLSTSGDDSLLMQWMSSLYDKGFFGEYIWGILLTVIFYLNGALAFVVSRKMRGACLSVSFAIAALVMMNPLGIEAFLARCCLPQLLYLTLLLSAFIIYRYHSLSTAPVERIARSALMVFLQIIAALVWDWGLLLFPQVAAVTLLANHSGSKREIKRGAIRTLFPMALCWIVVTTLLVAFREPSVSPLLSISQIGKQLFYAPVEGLFPLMRFDSLGVAVIGVLALLSYLLLFAMSYHGKATLGLVFGYFIALIPWVLFREPQASDFYLCMPFIYLAMTTFKDLKGFGNFCLFVFLAFNFIWMFQRLDDVQTDVRSSNFEESALIEKQYVIPYRQFR